MLSKKSFEIAGAAMLGTVALLGTNAANAAINLDDEKMTAVTFAQETVTGMVGDDGNYYEVNGGSDDDNTGTTLDVRGAIGIGATQDTEMVVTYTLQRMVFGTALTSDSIELHAADANQPDGFATEDILMGDTGQRALISGGAVGDMEAVFHVSVQMAPIAMDDVLILHVRSLGVMPGGGTVEVTVRNTVDDMVAMGKGTGMVMFDTGVKETSNDMDAMTFVVDNYMNFGRDSDDAEIYIDHVGNFMVGTQHFDATDGALATLLDVFGADAFSTTRETALENASITFDDTWFGFADEAWLDDMACDETSDRSVVWGPATADADDKEIMKIALTDLGIADSQAAGVMMTEMRYLCIEAPGGDTGEDAGSIPRTMPYTAETMYDGVADAKMPPMDGMITLGRINRDGIIVQLPYLTTSDRYVQRLVIVNRNEDDIAFTIEFATEAGKVGQPQSIHGHGSRDRRQRHGGDGYQPEAV